MLAVSWPSAAKFSWRRAPTIEAHSRGGMGIGGHYFYERGPGARIVGELEVAPMATADALSFRGFLHSLRGRAGTFLLPMPTIALPAGGEISGSLGASASAGSNAVTLSGFSAGVAVAGVWIRIGDTATGQTVQVVGTGLIAPRLRAAWANGTAVALGPVATRMRLAGKSTPVVTIMNGRSLPIAIEFEEAV